MPTSADELEKQFYEICQLIGTWPNEAAAANLVEQAERILAEHNRSMARMFDLALPSRSYPQSRYERIDGEHMVVSVKTLLSAFGWFIESIVQLARIKELPGYEEWRAAAVSEKSRRTIEALRLKVEESVKAKEAEERAERRKHLKVIE